MHDVGADAAVQLSVLKAGAEGFDPTTPVIISIDRKDPCMKKGSLLDISVGKFAAKSDQSKKQRVAKSSKIVGDMRAQRPLVGDDIKPVADLLDSFIDLSGNVDGTLVPTAMEVPSTPSVYGIEAGYSGASIEKDHLTTLRLSVRGTRSVVLARTTSLSMFFRAKRGIGDSEKESPTLRQLQGFFHNMTAEGAKLFTKKDTLFFATVSDGDALFVPAGFLVSEVVTAGADQYGFRRSYLFHTDVGVLQTLSDEILLLTGKAPPMAAHIKEAHEAVRASTLSSSAKEPGPDGASDAAKELTAEGVGELEAADANEQRDT